VSAFNPSRVRAVSDAPSVPRRTHCRRG